MLQGVGAEWWQRIERVVVEVHDVANRRHDVDSLLREEGGFTEVACGPDPDPDLKNSTLILIPTLSPTPYPNGNLEP